MIRAWRFWRLLVHDNQPRLWSVYIQCCWDGPALTADLIPRIGPSDIQMNHGIWCFKERQDTICNSIADPPVGWTYLGVLGGYIQIWGHVVEHDDGYRAEHALITAVARWVLFSNPVTQGRAYQLYPAPQRHYGVEEAL